MTEAQHLAHQLRDLFASEDVPWFPPFMPQGSWRR